jgi:hypothetical protein
MLRIASLTDAEKAKLGTILADPLFVRAVTIAREQLAVTSTTLNQLDSDARMGQAYRSAGMQDLLDRLHGLSRPADPGVYETPHLDGTADGGWAELNPADLIPDDHV